MTSSMRPAPGTLTRRVWDIADQLSAGDRPRARRADVIGAFVREGGNPNTANTQYQLWKADFEARHRQAAATRAYNLQVKEGGRVLLPADLRNALGVSEGDALIARVVDDELRVMPQSVALRRARQLLRQSVPAETRLVDGLIEERRRETQGDGT
jgi:bifunctional DNA-binding transcriptional regulator/antitoxin component of YhaV-PrlF toxin-antitoxin module